MRNIIGQKPCSNSRALRAVGESVQQPLRYYQNNVAGTLNLLQQMQQAGCQRLIFSSSATVYGNPQFLPLTQQHPLGASLIHMAGPK
ncbi:MAG: GDP-mannose 4,6-dehydratase [Rheinheimera sp.]|nr:GDP-mannose 4,6-dehydratase [Rheinheimera sp.]